jgi:hypothetical protein
MLVATGFAAAAAFLSGVGLADALLAFAPGGLEAMMVLALVLGLDPLYVGTHHLARFLAIGRRPAGRGHLAAWAACAGVNPPRANAAIQEPSDGQTG